MRKGRATILRVHLTIALLAGAGLVLVSVSGAALVFRPELDDAVFGTVRVPAGTAPAPLSRLVQAGHAAHPRLTPVTLILPERADGPARLRLERPPREIVEMLLDPGSARVLASRWLERSPLHALHLLHTELYLGARGRWASGALGLLLVAQGASGLFLWWPFTRRLSRGFTVRRGRRWGVVGYDLHKVVGIASLAFHLPMALTGALLVCWPAAGPPRADVVEVRERGRVVASLDRATGRVTPVAAGTLRALVATVHEGRFAGLASRALYVAAGLTPLALATTGFLIWLGRPRSRPLTPPSPQRGEGET